MRKIIVGIIAIIVLGLCLFGIATCHANHVEHQQQLKEEQEQLFQIQIDDVMIPEEWYIQDGFSNINDWWHSLIEMKSKYSAIASETISKWGDYLTDKQKKELENYSQMIKNSHSVNEINACVWEIEIIESQARENKEKAEQEAAAKKAASGFKSAGVLHYGGYRYTWYSSNELYHYMTPQWNLGSDGIYRDSNGYIIVASSTHSQGSIVDTPFGTGIVRDSGCAPGTIDVYTNF